jgi:hypothetical protein
MKIPEKYAKRLREQGYGTNVAFYEEFGDTVMQGLVGDIMAEFQMHGGKKLKKGDRWEEVLNTDNWTVKEIGCHKK